MSAVTPQVSSMRLPADPASVPAARRFLAARVGALDTDTQETAVLLVSEAVTNAVLHARTPVVVRCTTGPHGVLVEVTDESDLVPLPRQHDPEAVTGRGLEMVELLATAFGVVRDAAGKTVWFTVGDIPFGLPTGWSPAASLNVVRVALLSVPVRLYDVLQQHNELLLREYELILLAGGADASTREEVADAGRARGLIVEAIRRAVHRAGGAARSDVFLDVPAAHRTGIAVLPSVLDRAETAARKGEMLARPALPELLELRDWLYGEIARQLGGQKPRPWTGLSSFLGPPPIPESDVDLSWVARSTDAVVVADDANRIIGVSPAAAGLLGWPAEDLVGQRVPVIVPERLREDHVTGFMRQIVTGKGTLLGREVAVAALRRDGSEIDVRLRLERETAGSRSLYVARMKPSRPAAAD